jgi:hypothetical protein
MSAADVAINAFFLCEGIRDACERLKAPNPNVFARLYENVNKDEGVDGFVRSYIAPLAEDLAAITGAATSLGMEFPGVWEYEVVSMLGYDFYCEVMQKPDCKLNARGFSLSAGDTSNLHLKVEAFFGRTEQPCSIQDLMNDALLLRLN